MDTLETKAIVLGAINYNDTYKIMSLYSLALGKISVLWKYSKTKRNSFPLPFTEIELIATKTNKGTLYKLKDFSFINHSHNIHLSSVKMNITIFLCEIIIKVISFTEEDQKLYSFLSRAMAELNVVEDGKENFHIYFLIELTKYIGINPTINTEERKRIFSLIDGCFVNSSNMGLSEPESCFLRNLYRINIRNIHLFKLNRIQRNMIIDYIMKYYKIHLVGLSEIKSLEVLRTGYVNIL